LDGQSNFKKPETLQLFKLFKLTNGPKSRGHKTLAQKSYEPNRKQTQKCLTYTKNLFTKFINNLKILYALLAILAAWALQETATNGDVPIYQNCQLEAQDKINQHIKVPFGNGSFIEVLDSSNYHCSLGMYTEEMKYAAGGERNFLEFLK